MEIEEMSNEQLHKLIDGLAKIELLAQSMKMTLSHQGNMSASDWARIGMMNGQLSRCIDVLTVDMIGISHAVYNPIPTGE